MIISLHSNVIYNIFDEIKLYIRENIDNLDLSIYDYYLLHYLIPDNLTPNEKEHLEAINK